MNVVSPQRNTIMRVSAAISLGLILTPWSGAEAAPYLNGIGTLRAEEVQGFRVPLDSNLLDRRYDEGSNHNVERHQQYLGKTKVFGGLMAVFKDYAGQPQLVMGAHYPHLKASNQVKLSAAKAKAAAATLIGQDGRWKNELVVDPQSGRYFYIVENQRPGSRWIHWVDAESGIVINRYNGLTSGSGVGVLGDTKTWPDPSLTTYSASGNVWQMKSSDGRQSTYDVKNQWFLFLPGTLATDANNVWDAAGRTSPGQRAAVDAHYYARLTDTYYMAVHNWNWTSYIPSGIISSVHLDTNYANAYWDGTQMAYGDGDGVMFREMSGDLDIVGHELTHAVTEKTSNLVYQNDSGAMNEAFSDIMGTVIEYYNGTGNWTIGEDVTIASIASDGVTKGIRSLENPTLFGDPSCYADRYVGINDNGGVHTNSGIINHWFYLLVSGGVNAKPSCRTGISVTGIGLTAARDIVFNAFTALAPTANGCQARANTIAYAGLISPTYSDSVRDAWTEVGVSESLCSGTASGGALAVTVSTDKPSYNLGQPVVITINVQDSVKGCTTAVQGALVTGTLHAPLRTLTGSAATNSSCNLVFTYVPTASDGTGMWNGVATGKKTGYIQGSGSTSFTVQ